MSVYSEEIKFETNGEVDIIDITEDVRRIVVNSSIKKGIICIFIPGSTGAITTIEYEPGLKKDLSRTLEDIIPKEKYYSHHETWHDDNGHSHVRASLIGPSITLPVVNGKIPLGTWQQIIFVELDTKKRNRRVIIQLVGDGIKD